MFSDDSGILLFQNDARQRVSSRPGERYKYQCVHHSDGSHTSALLLFYLLINVKSTNVEFKSEKKSQNMKTITLDKIVHTFGLQLMYIQIMVIWSRAQKTEIKQFNGLPYGIFK